MPREIEVISGPLQEREVAIVGAGPVGLMVANLLGLAGVRVVVFERSPGLLGLPRAIAYDAETLRLFTQVGLFERIKPGLIPNPHVRYLNVKGTALMEVDFPKRTLYGCSALGTFHQPDFEKALLEGLSRFPGVAVSVGARPARRLPRHADHAEPAAAPHPPRPQGSELPEKDDGPQRVVGEAPARVAKLTGLFPFFISRK